MLLVEFKLVLIPYMFYADSVV